MQESNSTRLQALHEDRKLRIFDTKRRQIGIDKDALNTQVQDKIKEKELEKSRENKFVSFNARLLKEEIHKKQRKAQEKIINEIQLNDFRRYHQRKEFRSTHDLESKNIWNPKYFIYGDINQNSGRLKFEAENYDEERKKIEAIKLKESIKEQIAEKKFRDHNLKLFENNLGNDFLLENKIYKNLMKMEDQIEKDQNKNILSYNVLKAKENKIISNSKKLQNDNEVKIHIYNCLTSDFYLENPDLAMSALNERSINRNYFKGMTPDQINKILQARDQQIIEKKKNEQAKKSMNRYFETFQDQISRERKLEYKTLQQTKRLLRKQLDEENKLLAIEQRIARNEMKKTAQSNKPTEEFFAQFNKSTR